MKKIIIGIGVFIILAILLGSIRMSLAQSVIFSDDFNSYSVGDNKTSLTNWTSQSNTCDIISDPRIGSSGNVLKIQSENVILKKGGLNLTGNFSVSFELYQKRISSGYTTGAFQKVIAVPNGDTPAGNRWNELLFIPVGPSGSSTLTASEYTICGYKTSGVKLKIASDPSNPSQWHKFTIAGSQLGTSQGNLSLYIDDVLVYGPITDESASLNSGTLLKRSGYDNAELQLNLAAWGADGANAVLLDNLEVQTDQAPQPSPSPTATPAPPTPTPSLTPGAMPIQAHPRLYLSGNGDVQLLKTRLQNQKYTSELDTINTNAAINSNTGTLTTVPSGQYTNSSSVVLRIIEAKVLKYLLTGDGSYALSAYNMATNMTSSFVWKTGLSQQEQLYASREASNVVRLASIVYDWTYDYTTAQQKQALRTNIDGIVRTKLYPGYNYPVNFANSTVFTGFYTEEVIQITLLSFAIAVYDEDTQYFENIKDFILNKHITANSYSYASHTDMQGNSYGLGRFENNSECNYMLKKSGLFSVDDGVMSKMFYRMIYLRRPDGAIMSEGDMYTGTTWAPWQYWSYPMSFLYNANLFGDPYLHYEVTKGVAEDKKWNSTRTNFFLYLITDNPYITDKSPEDLPLSKYFGYPYGSIAARTSWQTGDYSNAVIAVMNIGEKYFGNHQHDDAGNFTLYYKGNLAIDSGVYQGTNGAYGSDHDVNYHKRSVAHNCMLVDDEASVFSLAGGSQNSTTFSTNDYQLFDINRAANRAKVLSHSIPEGTNSPDYSYIKGDLKASYKDRLDGYTRSMVFLNLKDDTYPATLIVYDNITSKNQNADKKWVLHTINQPAISGNQFTVLGPIAEDSRYTGKLVVDSLLPAVGNQSVQLVGGTGREYEVDGINYPITPYSGKLDYYEVGKWRIEASPIQKNNTDRFLNVLKVQSRYTNIELKTQYFDVKDFVGLTISDRAIFMARERSIIDAAVISISGKLPQYRYLVTDLKEGIWQVKDIRGKLITEKAVYKDENCLYFTAPPGTYLLSLK